VDYAPKFDSLAAIVECQCSEHIDRGLSTQLAGFTPSHT
jgi:hypothetical protein